MSTMPLRDWEDDQELADTDFSEPDDPFADDGFLSEFPDYAYQPLDEPFVPSSPVQTDIVCRCHTWRNAAFGQRLVLA